MKNRIRSLSPANWADIGLFYAAIVWGATFFLMKMCLEDIHAIALIVYRFGLATVLMVPLLMWQKKKLTKHWREGFLLGFWLWAAVVPQVIGLNYTSASNSGFITGLFVVIVPILAAILYRTLPSLQKSAAVALSFAGLWVLTGGIKGLNYGDALTLITALACAFHILYADRWVKTLDPYILTFQQFLWTTIFSVITLLLFDISLHFSALQTGIILLFLAIFPTFTAFLIQLVAQQYAEPIKVSIIFTLEPLFAALFAWTLTDETFTLGTALGGLLIFSGMLLAEIPLGKLKRQKK